MSNCIRLRHLANLKIGLLLLYVSSAISFLWLIKLELIHAITFLIMPFSPFAQERGDILLGHDMRSMDALPRHV